MQFLFLEVKLLVVGISWNLEIQDLALFFIVVLRKSLALGRIEIEALFTFGEPDKNSAVLIGNEGKTSPHVSTLLSTLIKYRF